MGRTKQLRSSGYIRAVNVWCEQNDIPFSEVCIRNYNNTNDTFDLYLRKSKKTIRMHYNGNIIVKV